MMAPETDRQVCDLVDIDPPLLAQRRSDVVI